MCILAWARCQSQGPLLSFRVAPWVGVLSLRIGKWALECSCVPKRVGATFCSKTGPFFSCGCSKACRVLVCPRRPKPHSAAKQGRSFRVAALSWVLSLRIEKWTLECSCVPKGVAAPFCSKTGPFFSCACSKPSSVHVCPQRSRPYSAAKQGRSFRVAALHSASPSINLENMADFAVPNSVHKMCSLAWARWQSQGPLLSFRVAPWVGVLSLRIGKWALECSCDD